jgi:hypothetical protein
MVGMKAMSLSLLQLLRARMSDTDLTETFLLLVQKILAGNEQNRYESPSPPRQAQIAKN